MDHADVAGAASCGPATKKMLEREFREYKHRERRLNYTKTRAVQVAIGERRKPRLDGKPGYLRVDTVHQGGLPKLLKTLKREMNLTKLWSGPSCAQGRCATRLRYAPTMRRFRFSRRSTRRGSPAFERTCTTRSGSIAFASRGRSSDMRGCVYHFLRSKALDANNFFNNRACGKTALCVQPVMDYHLSGMRRLFGRFSINGPLPGYRDGGMEPGGEH